MFRSKTIHDIGDYYSLGTDSRVRACASATHFYRDSGPVSVHWAPQSGNQSVEGEVEKGNESSHVSSPRDGRKIWSWGVVSGSRVGRWAREEAR